MPLQIYEPIQCELEGGADVEMSNLEAGCSLVFTVNKILLILNLF